VWKIGTGKHEEARKHGIPCVNKEWIIDCDLDRIGDFSVRPFEGVQFCSTGFLNYQKADEQKRLKEFVERNGGTFSPQMTPATDRLVITQEAATEPNNLKMLFAKKEGIQMVQWEDLPKHNEEMMIAFFNQLEQQTNGSDAEEVEIEPKKETTKEKKVKQVAMKKTKKETKTKTTKATKKKEEKNNKEKKTKSKK
jgi:hypothetical protein